MALDWFVIPAQAGIQIARLSVFSGCPLFAAMTDFHYFIR
jgi:hypothetical protein